MKTRPPCGATWWTAACWRGNREFTGDYRRFRPWLCRAHGQGRADIRIGETTIVSAGPPLQDMMAFLGKSPCFPKERRRSAVELFSCFLDSTAINRHIERKQPPLLRLLVHPEDGVEVRHRGPGTAQRRALRCAGAAKTAAHFAQTSLLHANLENAIYRACSMVIGQGYNGVC